MSDRAPHAPSTQSEPKESIGVHASSGGTETVKKPQRDLEWRMRRGETVASLITSIVVAATIVIGALMVGEYVEMVHSTGQGTNGPLGGMLILSMCVMITSFIGGTVIGAISLTRKRHLTPSFIASAIGAAAVAIVALIAAWVTAAAHPFLLLPWEPNTFVGSDSSGLVTGMAPIVSAVSVMMGMLVGFFIATLARRSKRR